jgi:hypothetical protein
VFGFGSDFAVSVAQPGEAGAEGLFRRIRHFE